MIEIQESLILLSCLAIASAIAVHFWPKKTTDNITLKNDDVTLNSSIHNSLESLYPPLNVEDHLDNNLFSPLRKYDGKAIADTSTPISHSSMIERIMPSHLDSLLDDIVFIETVKPMESEYLWKIITHLKSFSSLVTLYIWDTHSQSWLDAPESPLSYKVCCSIQLLNRKETMSVAKIADIHHVLEQLAKSYQGYIHYHTHGNTGERIQQLQDICDAIDMEIVLTVLFLERPILGSKLKSLCESSDCSLHSNGFLCRAHPDTHQNMFYIMPLHNKSFDIAGLKYEGYSGISLVIDITNTSDPLNSFFEMSSLAQKIAREGQGKIVDTQEKTLSDNSFDMIRQSIIKLSRSMASLGIVPGSPLSMRMFQ